MKTEDMHMCNFNAWMVLMLARTKHCRDPNQDGSFLIKCRIERMS